MPNPEQPIQENLADIKEPSKQTEGGLEIAKTEASERVVKTADQIHNAMEANEPVYKKTVDELREALSKLEYNFYGEKMTLQEIKEIQEQNKEAWEMITTGRNFNVWLLNRILTFLTPDVAKRLVERMKPNQNSLLYLDSLKSISTKVAQELIKHEGPLYLDGVEEMSLDVLKSLCQKEHKTGLSLGLKSISKEQAEVIKNYKGPISLTKLTEMDSASAHELGELQGYSLRLGLESLPPDVAQELANFKSDESNSYKKLSFISLQYISPESAQKFDSYVQELNFVTMEKIDLETAKGFRNFSGTLEFGDFIEFDDETAKALSESDADLGLNILKEISLQALRYFASRQKKVYLTGLEAENLTPEHLRIIANSENIVVDNEIKELAAKHK
ncbi:MAG: hypothetical protein WC663_01655 [Patescibacteria group bacterium]|jgi:hypothetical protein